MFSISNPTPVLRIVPAEQHHLGLGTSVQLLFCPEQINMQHRGRGTYAFALPFGETSPERLRMLPRAIERTGCRAGPDTEVLYCAGKSQLRQ